jgi:NDP-sugar pyrophosphorylase family protein
MASDVLSSVTAEISRTAASSMHAVIQAGGLGQRIRAVAEAAAKPMLRVGEEPMIARLIRQIAASGVRHGSVVIPKGNEQFRALLTQVAGGTAGFELDVIEEHTPLGNAGALGRVECHGRTVLFCFGDLVTDLAFDRMAAVHRDRRCEVTLASHHEHHQLSLGELVTDGARVERYVEKPRKQFLICSGVALFEPRVLELAKTLPTPFGLVDLINACLKVGYSVTHWMHDAYWIDVNTPELLQQARNDASKRSMQMQRR